MDSINYDNEIHLPLQQGFQLMKPSAQKVKKQLQRINEDLFGRNGQNSITFESGHNDQYKTQFFPNRFEESNSEYNEMNMNAQDMSEPFVSVLPKTPNFFVNNYNYIQENTDLPRVLPIPINQQNNLKSIVEPQKKKKIKKIKKKTQVIQQHEHHHHYHFYAPCILQQPNLDKAPFVYQEQVPVIFKTEKVQGKRIGRLTQQERLVKVRRYLEKRYKRKWSKKISYDCRKQAADERLRINGRFVKKTDQKEIIDKVIGQKDSEDQ